MIEGYLTRRPSLRLIVVLVDAKVGPTKLDIQMLSWLESLKLPWRVAATKGDQVSRSRAVAQRRDAAHALGLQPEQLAWTSADSGFGINELRAELAAVLAG